MMKKEISIAPMLDWTDSFFRLFIRQITHHALLYTEMIAEQAIIRGNQAHLLGFEEIEKPLALQIGGSTPSFMAKAAALGQTFGYDEININAGCPSSRVQAGAFGACLMANPSQVADCVRAMKNNTDLPVSIKTRIALEGCTNAYDSLCRFVETTANAGCQKFIIHARKARLKGLTPKENREKMPLDYPLVYQLKKDFPELCLLINGNITDLPQIKEHLCKMDGVMIGRRAYADPFFLKDIDRLYYQDNHPILSREQIVQKMLPFIEKHVQKGFKPLNVTRHIMGLYYGTPLAKKWKQAIIANNLQALYDFITQTIGA